MKNNHRFGENFLRQLKLIPAKPGNYFRGRRRWTGSLPDNILLFSRSESVQLLADRQSSDFHHRWVLLAALKGSAVVQVDRKPHSLVPGSFLLIPPLHLHYYHSFQPGSLAWLYITFDWPGQAPIGVHKLGPHPSTEKTRRHLHSLMTYWMEGGAETGTLLSAELFTLLLLLFPSLQRGATAPRQGAGPQELLGSVRREIETHPGRQLSIDEMARRLGQSASHLRAEFRNETGISLGRYLRESRLREAALLLSSENLSVKETAERLGFRDIYAFSRSFSQALGLAPSSLRGKTPGRR